MLRGIGCAAGEGNQNSGDTKMMKSIIAASALSTLTIFAFVGVAQAQVNCPPPGTSTKGCVHTPTTPQLPQVPPKQ
jgi:hypothetical protein